nr:hypothetical protein [uncultured Pedobacter sp.]
MAYPFDLKGAFLILDDRYEVRRKIGLAVKPLNNAIAEIMRMIGSAKCITAQGAAFIYATRRRKGNMSKGATKKVSA